jgi:asparagine synthase (glutamine-hydrolysing)
MCGIVGKVCLDEAVDRELIERMCDVVHHRGPDSRGIFLNGNAGLGVQRLAVIDLETGDQPIFNEDRTVVVVLNGEIYNYQELRESLSARGHRFSTQSDTEVIVHLYEDQGVGCVRALRGMFAFALWDIPRQRLMLARDRIGKKPLYLAFDRRCLWFASEAKAILQDSQVSREVNYSAVDSFLHYQYTPHDLCAFAALSKLPPAHFLVFEEGRIGQERYWKLSYEDAPHRSHDEWCELTRDQLLEATRLRLRSDVPVGAFLSGGVDSSAVVAAIAQQSPQRIKTFTIGFPNDRFDERPYAREVARLFDTEHSELVVEPEVADVLPRLVWHYDEPFADQSAIPSFYLSELTRTAVTVALNGDGGDESFAGYRRYVGNDLARRLERVPRVGARLGQRLLARVGTGSALDNRRARLMRLSQALQLGRPERYATWIACFDANARDELYTPEFRELIRGSNADAIIAEAYAASDAPTLIERLLDVDTQTYLPDQLLVKMDIASMAHSLEVRSPLLDHRLMQLAASAPLDEKVSRGRGKRLLKEAVRPWLDGVALDRPKQGFTMPIAEWLRRELKGLPAALLLDARARQRGLFDPQSVEALIREHQSRAVDNSLKLWALMQLELWFRTYIDVTPRGPIALDGIDLALAR